MSGVEKLRGKIFIEYHQKYLCVGEQRARGDLQRAAGGAGAAGGDPGRRGPVCAGEDEADNDKDDDDHDDNDDNDDVYDV